MLLKRIFDLISALIVLLVLAPIFVFICLWIKVSDKGPIFFIQERIGKHSVPFKLLKFRSMVHDPNGERRLVTSAEDSYITQPGKYLRQYKLDELPQLINIVLGHMSVVGPRPEVKKYIDCYSSADRKIVLSVKPGLTDYAAIEYRNEEALLAEQDDAEKYYINQLLPKKIALYKQYVNEQSFWVDFRIIFSTLRAIAS